jgi:hypothetical protein
MARFVRRPYLAAAGLGLAATATAAATTATLQPLAQAKALFQSQPIPANEVIALAQPLAGNRWTLVLLEQRQADTACWQAQADGTVLNLADGVRNETYCGRYASSGAYSLRVAGNDLSRPWQLKLEPRNGQLELQATSPQTTTPIVVAQAPIPAGSRSQANSPNSLVPLELQTGWSLERRSYEGRPLSHLYLSNSEPLPLLLARARSGGGALLAMPPVPPPPLATASRLAAPARSLRTSRTTAAPTTQLERSDSQPGDVIALQVVPFSE